MSKFEKALADLIFRGRTPKGPLPKGPCDPEPPRDPAPVKPPEPFCTTGPDTRIERKRRGRKRR